MKRSKSHLSGIRLMVQAAVAFSVMALCVKALSPAVASIQTVFFRSLLGVLMILWLIRAKKVSLWGRHRRKLVLRGVSGFLALALFFHAISKLPLGTAVFLNYTAPLFVAVLSFLFLRERIGPQLLFLIGMSFAGVYLLVEGTVLRWGMDVFWGLLSAFFAAVAYVTIRSIKHRESPLTIIFYFTAISALGSAPLVIPVFRWPSVQAWFLLAGTGLGAFWGQLWMTIALRRAPASLVSPFSYLTPLLSFFYGLVLWNERLTLKGLAGILLVITGGSLLSHYGTLRKDGRAATPQG